MRVERCYECGHRSIDWQWWKLRHFFKYTLLRRKRPVMDAATARWYMDIVEMHDAAPIFSKDALAFAIGTTTTEASYQWLPVSMPNFEPLDSPEA